MSNPSIIFGGKFAKSLTSRGVQLKSGQILEHEGAINYIGNNRAEIDTTGWATYADAAGNIPVDGTGGTATNLTFSRSTSSPLRDTASFSLVQANSTSLQGKGVSYAFSIDAADQANTLQIQFDYNASSTFVASNGITTPLYDGTTTTTAGNSDIEVFIYDVTNAVLIPVNSAVITANGGSNFKFAGTWQPAGNSTSYRLILHVATTSANATGWTFKFDNVFVGPQLAAPIGPAVSNWTSYTPTGSWSTNTTYTGFYRRVGDSVELNVKVATSGAPTSAALSINLPSGLVIDTAKLPSTVVGATVLPGSAASVIDNGVTQYQAFICYSSTTAIQVRYSSSAAAASPDTMAAVTQAAPMTFGSGDSVVAAVVLPIVGWDSNSILSSDAATRVVAAKVTGSAVTGTIAASFASATDVTFGTLDFDTHAAFTGTSTYKIPVSGVYQISAQVYFSGSESVDNIVLTSIGKNGTQVMASRQTVQSGSLTTDVPGICSGIINCVAGDVISVRGVTTITSPAFVNDTNASFFSIHRLSGPTQIAAVDTVAARYYASATAVTGSLATVSWTTKDFDTHNDMSAGTYTVPVSGKYQINCALALSGTIVLNNTVDLQLQKNGSVIAEDLRYAGGALTNFDVGICDVFACVAGDTIRAQISSSATGPAIVSSNSRNFISIIRVGN